MPTPANAGGGGPPPSDSKSQASREIGAHLNQLINDATIRFRPLDYEYDEELLKIVDRVEASLSGKSPGPPPRDSQAGRTGRDGPLPRDVPPMEGQDG